MKKGALYSALGIAAASFICGQPLMAQAAAVQGAVASQGGSSQATVLKDCNRGGSNCQVVRRYSSAKICQRERASYRAVNPTREVICTSN